MSIFVYVPRPANSKAGRPHQFVLSRRGRARGPIRRGNPTHDFRLTQAPTTGARLRSTTPLAKVQCNCSSETLVQQPPSVRYVASGNILRYCPLNRYLPHRHATRARDGCCLRNPRTAARSYRRCPPRVRHTGTSVPAACQRLSATTATPSSIESSPIEHRAIPYP